MNHARMIRGVAAAGMLALAAAPLAAQGSRPPLDFVQPAAPDTLRRLGIPDSVLRAALEAFNTAASRGTGLFASGSSISGSLGLYRGPALLSGQVNGPVVMINGDLRLAATARVEGRVTVLGGRLIVDQGAAFQDSVVYEVLAPVELRRDGTLHPRRDGRSLIDYASTSFSSGRLDGRIGLALGAFNRVEELPILVRPTATWRPDSITTVHLDLLGVARTGSAPSSRRQAFGGSAAAQVTRGPVGLGIDVGDLILPMRDQPWPEADPGINALLFRRDYRDWYAARFWGFNGRWTPARALSFGAGVRFSRETSVREVEAFSLLHADEAWRPNPLIDDGNFVTTSLDARYDTRDDQLLPTSGWLLRGEIRRVTSHSVVPVSLPASIRGPVDADHYSSSEIDFDARYYQRLTPTRTVHLRLAGGGHLGGDPLTMQRRRAMGGNEPLGGYPFRALNCDSRRRPDIAVPALCDRQMIAQIEVRQALRLDLSTRVGGYAIGFQQPDLVLIGDAGSAWLSGAGEGRVPSNRIQAIGEWRSSVGIGLDGGSLGIYMAKALSDREPVRFFFRFSPRF